MDLKKKNCYDSNRLFLRTLGRNKKSAAPKLDKFYLSGSRGRKVGPLICMLVERSAAEYESICAIS